MIFFAFFAQHPVGGELRGSSPLSDMTLRKPWLKSAFVLTAIYNQHCTGDIGCGRG